MKSNVKTQTNIFKNNEVGPIKTYTIQPKPPAAIMDVIEENSNKRDQKKAGEPRSISTYLIEQQKIGQEKLRRMANEKERLREQTREQARFNKRLKNMVSMVGTLDRIFTRRDFGNKSHFITQGQKMVKSTQKKALERKNVKLLKLRAILNR